ncbi:MAG: galactokinase family protein [Planctomycetales bacterium]
MPLKSSLYSIVLAAGKGRRMRNQQLHKVCFDVAGTPAIHRALDVYNRVGIVRNVIVVGDLAGQVVELVGRKFPNAVFTYQPEALGTGDAARCGLVALADADPEARILIVAGDKLIDNATLTRLVDRCEAADADLGILVSPAEWGGGSAGRVLFDDDGLPVAIVEAADLKLLAARADLRRMLETTRSPIPLVAIQEVVDRRLGTGASVKLVLEREIATDGNGAIDRGWLDDRLAALPCAVVLPSGGMTVSAEEALKAPLRNESVYLVRKRAIDFGLHHLPTHNAQGEMYLTDAIGAICAAQRDGQREYRVCHVATETPHEVMSYNDPEELLRIEDYYHGQRHQSLEDLKSRLGSDRLKTVDEWLQLLSETGSAGQTVREALAECYGDEEPVLAERIQACRNVLLCFRKHFGGVRQVILVRSPGRINLMGRHIDWQGGRCNLMAVNQEVLMAVSPRSDDLIEVRNLDPSQFPNLTISLGRLVSRLDWDDWLSMVNSSETLRHLRESAGSWNLYIEAAMLRLQMAFRDRLLHGMDMAVLGNIPVAAGLSSSSAIVVATAESALALNGISLAPQQFVNFCGEGEWFVGTRGGSADHAAMKFGAKGTINHVAFHDFELLEQLAFPASHALMVCNSHVQARKAAGAKAAFNSRVGSYLVGVQLVRKRFKQYAPFVRFVRDINCTTLDVPPSRIYEILLALPESLTAEQVRREFQEDPAVWSILAPHFQQAEKDAEYPVRGVLMFGLAECARAARAAECLRRQDVAQLGALMNISHDGERCFTTQPDGTAQPFQSDVSDEALQRLIADLTSQDMTRIERAQLYHQPGAYRCSTVEIDTIVDIAGRTPGVIGAQIAGAGLGGCAMVLVQVEAVADLVENLTRQYYAPRNLPPSVIRCTPSAGSCLVSIPAS